MRRLLLVALALCVLWLPARGQDGGDGIELDLHGFLLELASARTTGEGPTDLMGWEQRLRLDLTAWPDFVDGSAVLRTDLVHDRVEGELRADLREAYAEATTGPLDFRVGRQVITWGVGDLLFINDVFPNDYESFFIGRPLEYLKVGADGVRLTYSSEPINAELVVLPFFQPDRLPGPDRFAATDPFAAAPLRVRQWPASPEYALRAYRRLGDFDVAAYAYRGFWRAPALRPGRPVTEYFPPLSVYGLSAQGNALGGVLSLETGFYDSRGDRGGSDPAVPNSEVRALVGYQRELAEDLSLGLQYYAEIPTQHDAYLRSLPPRFPARRSYRDLVMMRVTRLLERQALRLSLVAFYSPVEHDSLIQPEVSYRLTDDLTATLGANVFGGGPTTSLGRFDADDNVYFWVRYNF